MTTALEDRLHDAFHHLDTPDVDLTNRVLDAIALATPHPRLERRAPRRRWALVAVALVGVAVLATTPAREAVANWFGIGATSITINPDVTLDGVSSVEDLGTPAPASVDRPKPFALWPPADQVFDDAALGRSFAWMATPDYPAIPGTDIGMVLSVRHAEGAVFAKTVPLAEHVVRTTLTIGGDTPVEALWITGPHALLAEGLASAVIANNVLLWESNDVAYRLETNIGLERTKRFAESMQPGTELLLPG